MKKTIVLFAIASLLMPMMAVQADGCLIPHYTAAYKDIYEPEQSALLVFDNGHEDLYIKVAYEGRTDKFVWIVPTPSFPKAELAPEDIFEELSIFTSPYNDDIKGEWENFDNDSKDEGTNVIVHSREQVGIYEVTVLSATGADGLLTWLKSNNYLVGDDVKETLDWYIEKNWYFTAMRINKEGSLEKIINELNIEYGYNFNKSNIATELPAEILESIKENDYDKFEKIYTYLFYLAADWELKGVEFEDVSEDMKEQFNAYRKKYEDGKEDEIRKELSSDEFSDWLKEGYGTEEEITKYNNDYI